MKIDLHIHNKKIFSGESEKVNVEPKDFKSYLKNAKIGIAAITNHHYFEKEHFLKYTDPTNYILFPGMEINIEDEIKDNKKSHLNIIFSNSEKEMDFLHELNKNIFSNLNNFKKEKYIFKWDLFKKTFKGKKIIILMDAKSDDKTKVSDELSTKISNLNEKWVLLFDANNQRTLKILQSKKKNSIIGSDIKNWKSYSSISSKLLNIKYKINNFQELCNNLCDLKSTKNFTKETQKPIKQKIKIEQDNFIIDIYEGLNLLIGDKATGKTKILESIEENNKQNHIKTVVFYTSQKEERFSQIMNKTSIFQNNKKIEFEIKENIKFIAKTKWTPSITPFHFKNLIISDIKSKYKIQNMKYEKNIEHSYDKIRNFLNEIKNFKKEIEKIRNDIKNIDKQIFEKFEYILSSLKQDIIKKYFNKYKNDISNKIIYSIAKKIKNIIEDNNQILSENIDIELLNKWNWVKKIKNKRDEILSMELEKKEEINSTFNMPDLQTIELVDKNNLFDFCEKANKTTKEINQSNKKNNLLKHKIGDWNKNVYPFFGNKKNNEILKKIQKFQTYWISWFEKDEEISIIIAKRELRERSGEVIPLSYGQRSLFILLYALEEEAQFYLLDEPSSNLGSNSMLNFVNQKIEILKKRRKKIIVASHNSNLGINAIPQHFIFRKKENNIYDTYKSQGLSKPFINSKNKIISFNDVVLNIFEGGKNNYNYRKDVYENKI